MLSGMCSRSTYICIDLCDNKVQQQQQNDSLQRFSYTLQALTPTPLLPIWIDIFANARSQHEPMYMHFEDDWRIHKPKILLCIIFPKDLLSHFTHWYIEFPCLESIFIFIQGSIHWYSDHVPSDVLIVCYVCATECDGERAEQVYI